jgi:hypothetical protein
LPERIGGKHTGVTSDRRVEELRPTGGSFAPLVDLLPQPLAGIGLADYTDAVTGQIKKLARHLLRRLVYVSAYVPVNLASANDYSQLPENKTSISGTIVVADPVATGAVRINPRNGDPDYLERGRQALYNDLSTEEFLKFAVYLNPDLPVRVGVEEARGTTEGWGRVPRAFVRLNEDHTVPPALQDRMIREADAATPGNPFTLRALESSHSPFASMPDRLADALVED